MAALIKPRLNLNLETTKHCFFSPSLLPAITTTTTTTTTFTHETTSNEVKTLSDIKKLEVLGQGNGGTVYKACHNRTQAIYALKIMHGSSDTMVRRQILQEIEILRQTNSPYVVQCHGIFEKPDGDIAILMEYMDAGTLDSYVKKNGVLSEELIANIACQILRGFKYLCTKKIVHRDIKPSNLLINQNLDVKIADFGVSKIMKRRLDRCTTHLGTCAYMSPERFDPQTHGSEYDGFAADVWSFGVSLMELYMGHYPFLEAGQKPDWPTLMCAICFGEPPRLPDTCSENFRDFIQCCLQKDASKRWTASQLLLHPFLAHVVCH